MKKGGVREINSFISVNSPTKSSFKLTDRKLGVGERSTNKPKEGKDDIKTKINVKLNHSESISKTRSESQTNKVKRSNEAAKNTQVQKPPPSKLVLKSKSNLSSKINTVKTESPLKTRKNSILEEKRGTSLGKFTMEDVYKRRLSHDLSKKTPTSSVIPNVESEIVRKEEHSNENILFEKIPDETEYEYEDDFEDYESDFESYSGSNESVSPHESETSDHEDQKGNEEEKKMDSGSYDLYRSQKQKNQLEIIREALKRENSAVEQLNNSTVLNNELDDSDSSTFLTEFNKKSLQNFSSARQRQRNSLISNQIKTRGQKLLEMVTLDVMHYNLYEMAPVPYEVFMRCYANKNTSQVSTKRITFNAPDEVKSVTLALPVDAYVQTNEDNVNSEIQTEEIHYLNKWTQYPVEITKNVLLQETNLKQALIGVGDDTPVISTVPEYNLQKLINFMKTAGEEMIALLEEETTMRDKITEKFDTNTKISDSISRLKCDNISILKGRPIISILFDPYSQFRLLTLHGYSKLHEEKDRCSYLCIWNVHQPTIPKVVLRSYGLVSCCCFVGGDSSFVVAGHDDGSLCVWDLRESTLYCEQVTQNNSEIRIRSSSYNTADVLKSFNHTSRIVDIVALLNDEIQTSNDFKIQQIYSIEEDSYIIIWNLSRSFTKTTDIASAPWSKIKFFASQVIDVVKFIPKIHFQTSVFKVSSESKIFIGTNTGLTLKCSSYDKNYKTYGKSLSDLKDKSKVTCLEICPYNPELFVVGFDNGNIRLYNSKYIEPITNIEHDVHFVGIESLSWLWCKRNYIVAFNLCSVLLIYRFHSESYSLVYEVKLNDICSISVSSFAQNMSSAPYLALKSSKGFVEVHKFNEIINSFEE